MAKTTQPLSASQVSALKAKSSTYTVGDGRGLFIRVGATGRKSWVFRYKKPTTGKTTNWAFAPYPQKSLADARAMAEDYRAILADDRCPQESTAQQIDSAFATQVPDVRWTSNLYQGYVRLVLTAAGGTTDYVAVSTVTDREYHTSIIRQEQIARDGESLKFA